MDTDRGSDGATPDSEAVRPRTASVGAEHDELVVHIESPLVVNWVICGNEYVPIRVNCAGIVHMNPFPCHKVPHPAIRWAHNVASTNVNDQATPGSIVCIYESSGDYDGAGGGSEIGRDRLVDFAIYPVESDGAILVPSEPTAQSGIIHVGTKLSAAEVVQGGVPGPA